jgi:hypothetical protein
MAPRRSSSLDSYSYWTRTIRTRIVDRWHRVRDVIADEKEFVIDERDVGSNTANASDEHRDLREERRVIRKDR